MYVCMYVMHACMHACMYVPIIKKYIYMLISLWLYEECSVFNLVLVIKDQGYALTIDYIKKKQKKKITDPGVSSYS